MPKKPKRCKATNTMGMRCSKRRDHPEQEIDVVHQAGMFVWRSDVEGRSQGMTLTNAKVTLGGLDLGPFIKPNSLVFTKSSVGDPDHPDYSPAQEARNKMRREGQRATRVIFDEAHSVPVDEPIPCSCAGCRYERGEISGPEALGIPATRSGLVSDEMLSPPNPYAGIEPVYNDPITVSQEQQLTEWWIQQAEDEVARTVPKAIEYSATDLTDIGHDLARTQGRIIDDEEAAELGVFFYLRGKMARWVGAVIAGQRVSDDTLFDIGVYVRMAQRIREKGNWPGTEQPDA